MEIDVFLALKSAGIPEAVARTAVAAIRKNESVEPRESQKEVATKGDLSLLKGELKMDMAIFKTDMATMKSEIVQQLFDLQRFVVASIFGSSGMLAVLITVFNYLR